MRLWPRHKPVVRVPVQPTARLKSVSRGFAGDNAVYEGRDVDGNTYELLVTVGWALMVPYETSVTLIDGTKHTLVVTYHDGRYVQPAEALSRLGYQVSGTVDFAAAVEPAP